MIGKILFTLAIIAGAIAFVRFRQQREQIQQRPPLHLMGDETSATPQPKPRWAVRSMAGVAVALMLAASGFFLYEYWRDAHQVIQLRVVDTTSGKSTEYSAYRGDVSARAFTTVDGVQVMLSEHDRIEISRPPHQQLSTPSNQN